MVNFHVYIRFQAFTNYIFLYESEQYMSVFYNMSRDVKARYGQSYMKESLIWDTKLTEKKTISE